MPRRVVIAMIATAFMHSVVGHVSKISSQQEHASLSVAAHANGGDADSKLAAAKAMLLDFLQTISAMVPDGVHSHANTCWTCFAEVVLPRLTSRVHLMLERVEESGVPVQVHLFATLLYDAVSTQTLDAFQKRRNELSLTMIFLLSVCLMLFVRLVAFTLQKVFRKLTSSCRKTSHSNEVLPTAGGAFPMGLLASQAAAVAASNAMVIEAANTAQRQKAPPHASMPRTGSESVFPDGRQPFRQRNETPPPVRSRHTYAPEPVKCDEIPRSPILRRARRSSIAFGDALAERAKGFRHRVSNVGKENWQSIPQPLSWRGA